MYLYANLDFEYELACEGHYIPARPILGVCRAWSRILRLLDGATEADYFDWEPGSKLSPNPSGNFIPWGLTPTVKKHLKTPENYPAVKAVRDVNSKVFSHRLEQALGLSLPGSCLITSLDELKLAVHQCPSDWVLKHPLGVGGRERCLGHQGELLQSAENWVRKRLEAGWTLVFEPWIYNSKEFSYHFDVHQEGGYQYHGHTELWTGNDGSYQGNLVSREENPGAPDWADRLCQSISEAGYWGPVGVDSMTNRPIMEINARYSFGRMALELGRHIPPEWTYAWWQPKREDVKIIQQQASEFPQGKSWSQGLYRLPDFLGQPPAFVLVAGSAEELTRERGRLIRSQKAEC